MRGPYEGFGGLNWTVPAGGRYGTPPGHELPSSTHRLQDTRMTRPTFNHVGVHVRDIDAARRFYDAVLACIGLERYADIAGFRASAYGVHQSSFRVVQPDGPIAASSSHVALTAASRAQVDEFHRRALELGATSVEAPHTYDDSADGQQLVAYTASVKDADGNWIEAVFVSPA